MATWIYLVRHGQTVWNEEGRLCGSSDIPLSEEGLAQAQRLAKRLKSVNFSAIYSSPLKRAKQTAQEIASLHQLPVLIEDDLREIDYGDWEGMKVAEAVEKFPEIERLRREEPMKFAAPNGEPMKLFAQRVIAAVQKIASKHAGENFCIVAHQTVNRFILCWTLTMDFRFWRQLRQDPACVNLFQVREDGLWRVCLINDTCHLQ
ncbi:MAG: histidine phosphatase family protein [Armatimonadetes bacterium]|nr:histidine phosphatase family protein [Armatimonadota bacterium]MDW8027731.1 histidine phosphatase family protein [Armatimonadota bacterium]